MNSKNHTITISKLGGVWVADYRDARDRNRRSQLMGTYILATPYLSTCDPTWVAEQMKRQFPTHTILIKE